MNTPKSEAERYAYEQCLSAQEEAAGYCADDPRTYGVEETIAYLREQRERARDSFQARFDAPPVPRQVSARQALRNGDWGGFFGSCLAG